MSLRTKTSGCRSTYCCALSRLKPAQRFEGMLGCYDLRRFTVRVEGYQDITNWPCVDALFKNQFLFKLHDLEKAKILL